MSAIAGIFRFDPREQVLPEELAMLIHGLDRLGPDGGGEILDLQVAIAFRAFHTTPESHLENQPLCRDGVLLAFDGRLDNRERLCSSLNVCLDQTTTDVDLVSLAYRKWGKACFAELEGDWATSIWDRSRRQLILARDVFGVRRLFYRHDEGGIAWSTALEPLVQTYAGTLHLDLEYLAGCLYPRPPIETTPYHEICACLPSTVMLFDSSGLIEAVPYWNLNPHAKIRYTSDRDYEMQFRAIFQEAVSRRLRADRPILAELSGGIDSSSIVCMADSVGTRQSSVPVESLSYFDPDEPSGDERAYICEIERHRQRTGHHISIADFVRESPQDRFAPLPQDHFAPIPGFFSSSLRWDSKIAQIQEQTNARIVLSGLGGDELLGGVQYEAPELAECIRDRELPAFVRAVYRWAVSRKKSVVRLTRETFQLLRAATNPNLLGAYEGSTLPWALVKPPNPGRALLHFARWGELSPWGLCTERIRFAVAQQLSGTEPPLVGCVEKRYPYLDRSLFVFLASIPRTQILQPGKRRWLMRRALRGLVPDPVLFRRSKWFGYRRPLVALREERVAIERMFDDPWLSDGVVGDASSIRKRLELASHGSTDDALVLMSAIGIEQWMRCLARHARVAMPLASFEANANLKGSALVQREVTLAERR